MHGEGGREGKGGETGWDGMGWDRTMPPHQPPRPSAPGMQEGSVQGLRAGREKRRNPDQKKKENKIMRVIIKCKEPGKAIRMQGSRMGDAKCRPAPAPVHQGCRMGMPRGAGTCTHLLGPSLIPRRH